MTCVMHCDVLITIFVVLICVEAFFTTQHACVSPSQSLLSHLGIAGIQTVWSSFSFVLGFLIVFRSNQARELDKNWIRF